MIGGGILGISTAWHAAQSGLRVAVVDAGDFAGATSSASSKLLHGGLRYLQTGAVKLVAENHFERRAVSRQVAPHLANPLTFYLPVYKGGPHGAAKLGAGVFAYSALSAFGDGVGHLLSPAKAAQDVPELRTDNLKAVAVYGDDQMNDARMALMTVRAAVESGAVVLNHAEVTGLRFTNGRVTGAELKDRLSGDEFGVNARLVLNATGPWVDHLRRMEDPAAAPSIRLSKGAHLVLKRTAPWKAALATPIDKYRITFALPWEDMLLLGTTDEEFEGDPADVAVNEKDIAQILDEAAFSIRDQQLDRDLITYSFAGLRVLPGGPGDTAKAKRETVVTEGRGGMLSVAGGKWTSLPPHRPYGDEEAGGAAGPPAGRRLRADLLAAEEAAAARRRQPARGRPPAAGGRLGARPAHGGGHRQAPGHALRLARLRHRPAREREPGAGPARPPGCPRDLGAGRVGPGQRVGRDGGRRAAPPYDADDPRSGHGRRPRAGPGRARQEVGPAFRRRTAGVRTPGTGQ
ncbi:hypothetical protein SVIOM342S_01773 [Streptomyces violaceorubidus]